MRMHRASGDRGDSASGGKWFQELGAEFDVIDFDSDLFQLGERAYHVHRCAMLAELLLRVPVERSRSMSLWIKGWLLSLVSMQLRSIYGHTWRRNSSDGFLALGLINLFFEKWDLLVCPTIHTIPELLDARPPEPSLTMLFNASCNPAISIPCGVDSAGLPVGLQINWTALPG
jgi:Asp-tRNA(Asn)/Glu-tRNA(Gln) amidotransferase A subunit family amidase